MIFPPRPRTPNVFKHEGMPLVAKVPHFNGDYLPQSVNIAVELLGGLDLSIRSGDKVIIKPNFNCSFALPLATDLAFLADHRGHPAGCHAGGLRRTVHRFSADKNCG